MPGEDCPGRDHTAGADSRGRKTSGVRREAAAMAAAHAETTTIKNQALDDVLAHIMRTVPMSDEARARIAGLIGQWGP